MYYDQSGSKNYHGIVSNPDSNDICLSSVPPTEPIIAYLSFNRDGYSSHCREYKSYWQWVDKRNEQRYHNNIHSGQDYDTKNMMHTIRLLQVALEIMTQGTVTNKRPNRQELLDIKHGKFAYNEILDKADILVQQIEFASEYSSLPEAPDPDKVIQILIKMRDALYSE